MLDIISQVKKFATRKNDRLSCYLTGYRHRKSFLNFEGVVGVVRFSDFMYVNVINTSLVLSKLSSAYKWQINC